MQDKNKQLIVSTKLKKVKEQVITWFYQNIFIQFLLLVKNKTKKFLINEKIEIQKIIINNWFFDNWIWFLNSCKKIYKDYDILHILKIFLIGAMLIGLISQHYTIINTSNLSIEDAMECRKYLTDADNINIARQKILLAETINQETQELAKIQFTLDIILAFVLGLAVAYGHVAIVNAIASLN